MATVYKTFTNNCHIIELSSNDNATYRYIADDNRLLISGCDKYSRKSINNATEVTVSLLQHRTGDIQNISTMLTNDCTNVVRLDTLFNTFTPNDAFDINISTNNLYNDAMSMIHVYIRGNFDTIEPYNTQTT